MKDNEKAERKRKVEILNGYIWLDDNIKIIEGKLEEINAKIYNIHRQQLSDSSSKNSKENYLLEELIDKKIEYCKIVQEELKRNYEKRKKIEQQIYSINDELQKNIIIKKYMYHATFAEISEKIAYCENQVKILHDKALEKINI